MPVFANDIILAASIVLGLVIALELGFRGGRRRAKDHDPPASGQVGAIQGALLGLLALLLGFSFAAAGGRFLERQDVIAAEANAIGTAYLRADLLGEPHRTALRDSIQRYAEHRVALSATLRDGFTDKNADEVGRLHDAIWRAAMAGVEERPGTMLGVLAPVNDAIDLHTLRLASGRKHLPLLVTGLLLSCSLLAIAVIGYGCGLSGARHAALTWPLALLIAAALWITIDLDHPRAGLLQLNDLPLKELRFGPPSP